MVGGLQLVDNQEADDKILAVLANDNFWSKAQDVQDLPEALVERLIHYFSTYKMIPDQESRTSIDKIYGAEHAYKVLTASMEDYEEEFGT